MNEVAAEEYCATASRLGADSAVAFEIADIVFDPRTILKCMYGCEVWGQNPMCPSRPGSLLPWHYAALLKRYTWGIIVHSHLQAIAQSASFQIERKAFLDGYYLAFSLSDCTLCEKCAGLSGNPCVNPKEARPAFHSVGIDVFATVRKFNLPIETLKSREDPQNWYAAVFVE